MLNKHNICIRKINHMKYWIVIFIDGIYTSFILDNVTFVYSSISYHKYSITNRNFFLRSIFYISNCKLLILKSDE